MAKKKTAKKVAKKTPARKPVVARMEMSIESIASSAFCDHEGDLCEYSAIGKLPAGVVSDEMGADGLVTCVFYGPKGMFGFGKEYTIEVREK